jgi:hypothetical protein
MSELSRRSSPDVNVGNRWWRLRINRYEFKLRLWAFDFIVEHGSVRRNADWGFDGVVIDLPAIMLTVIDPRRLDGWDGHVR